jgi:hypothetical protein
MTFLKKYKLDIPIKIAISTLPILFTMIILDHTTDIFKTNPPEEITEEIPDNFPDFGDENTSEDGDMKRISLYESFIMTQPINGTNIVDISQIVQVEGEIESATLAYNASTSAENGKNNNRRHTVYFYIDNGRTGGHLGANYQEGIPTGDFFTFSKTPYEKRYALEEVPLSIFPNGPTHNVDVEAILNDNERHYIGAFVSTGVYGVLNDMWIEYYCKTETCSISLL